MALPDIPRLYTALAEGLSVLLITPTPVSYTHLYDQFKRSGKKPSEFCKINLRRHDVKSYDFVKQYFSFWSSNDIYHVNFLLIRCV